MSVRLDPPPLVPVAALSGRLYRQGTARAAAARLNKEVRRARQRAEAARLPWRSPGKAVFDLSGVALSPNGIRSLIHCTRLLAWDGKLTCPAQVRFSGLDDDAFPVALAAAAKGMASVSLRGQGEGWVEIEVGPWQRSAARRELMMRLVERDGAACAWCSCTVDPLSEQASLDHVKLASRGGSYALENLLLACVDCNRARGDLEAEVWLERCLAKPGQRPRYPIVAAALARRDGQPSRL